MASQPSATQVRSESNEQLRAQSTWAVVAGLALSVLLHGTLVAVMLIWGVWRSAPRDLGGAEAGFHKVGLYVKPDSGPRRDSPDSDDPQADNDARPDASRQTARAPDSPVPDVPPAPVLLPEAGPKVIGPGPAAPAFSPGSVDGPLKSIAIAKPLTGGPVTGRGEASFFGIKDDAMRVVYAVDCSGSMLRNSRMQFARASLVASLNRLEPPQQFQIIFYSDFPREMKIEGRGQGPLNPANDINKTLARQYVAAIRPDGGTDHLRALKQALRLEPDVLYFLTDAKEPQLTAGELDQVGRLNRGRTRIHCIEFGEGPNLSRDNFLERLARQNGGQYRYEDVTSSPGD